MANHCMSSKSNNTTRKHSAKIIVIRLAMALNQTVICQIFKRSGQILTDNTTYQDPIAFTVTQNIKRSSIAAAINHTFFIEANNTTGNNK